MRRHLLEHDPFDYARTNITLWADRNGHLLSQSYICNMEELPALEELDWLMEILLNNMAEEFRLGRS